MRLAYLADSVIPSRAANSIQVMKMCSAFSDHHAVTLMVPKRQPAATAPTEIFSYYGVKPSFEMRLLMPRQKRLQRLTWVHGAGEVWRRRCNLIYSRSLVLGERVNRLTRVPVIFEAHKPVRAADQDRFATLIDRPSFRRLVVISRALRDHFLTLYPQLEGRVLVAHDAAEEPPADLIPRPLRRKGRLVVGYCGQLLMGRGVDIIIALAKSMPEVDFHVVGGEEADLEYWRKESGGPDNLIFHGFCPPSQAQCYIAAFDVALAPYQRQLQTSGGRADTAKWMSPLKIFEYMSAGKPIVSSDHPVLQEVLIDGVNSLLCPPDDVNAWRQAVQHLADASVRHRLSMQARSDFKTEFTWTRRAQKVIADLAV